MIASTYTKLEGPTANQMMRLLEALDMALAAKDVSDKAAAAA